MIIVEGPDGGGKSTLIAALQHERWHRLSMRGGVGGGDKKNGWTPIKNVGTAYYDQIIKAQTYESRTKLAVAFDRFHLSERVYGPLLRDEQLVTDDILDKINALVHRKRIPVVICMPPFDVTLKNVMREGRPSPAFQTEEFLQRAYDAWKLVAPYATVMYDFTNEWLPDLSGHEHLY